MSHACLGALLLVEDDLEIADFLQRGLTAEGYTVDHQATARSGEAAAQAGAFDTILLDVMLPDGTGHSVCAAVRAARIQTPILMLTALDSLDDKVRGLRTGADDYLCKPFEFEELLARIEALIRRHKGTEDISAVLTVADLTLDASRFRVFRADREVTLTSKEFALLELLMSAPDRVFAKDQIRERIWGEKGQGAANVLEVCIGRLRKKIDLDGLAPLIHTVRGHGYKVGPASADADLGGLV